MTNGRADDQLRRNHLESLSINLRRLQLPNQLFAFQFWDTDLKMTARMLRTNTLIWCLMVAAGAATGSAACFQDQ